MRIADVFMFHDELDLLRVRLAEHRDFVERFYLIEATRTHRFAPKPMYFAEHRDEFAEYADKLEYVRVDADVLFQPDDPFGNERRQRTFLNAFRSAEMASYDYLLHLDADEIIDRRRFPVLLQMMQEGYPRIAPVLDLYFYFLNAQLERQWSPTRIFRVNDGQLPDVNIDRKSTRLN